MSESTPVITLADPKVVAPSQGDTFDRLDTVKIEIAKDIRTGERRGTFIGVPYSSATDAYDLTDYRTLTIDALNPLIALNPELQQAFGAFVMALNKAWRGELVYPVVITGNPGAALTITQGQSTTSGVIGENGTLPLGLPKGEYAVAATLANHDDESGTLAVVPNVVTTLAIPQVPIFTLTVTTLPGAEVFAGGKSAVANESGVATIAGLRPSKYLVIGQAEGYTFTNASVQVIDADLSVELSYAEQQQEEPQA